ncbi:hypothetical protein ACVWXL_004782 [Bradyrhizobium sp. GM22.5]
MGRDVAPDHAHHHAGKRLVASAVSDQRIVGETMDDGFDRVGNQLPRKKGELHPFVIHADTVGNRHGRKLARRAAGLFDTGLGRCDLKVVRHVAGRLLALHADDADHRLGNRSVVEPHGAHERAVRSPVEAIRRDPRSELLHTCIFFMQRPGSSWTRRRSRSVHSPDRLYCSGATIVECLNCATSNFGSIPVSA